MHRTFQVWVVEQLAATYHQFTGFVWLSDNSLKMTLNFIFYIAPTTVLHLKHFWDLFSKLWLMSALEAVSLTGPGNSELQCYSFFVPKTVLFCFPLWGKGSSLHWSDRPIFVFSAVLSIFIFCKCMLFWNSLQYSAHFPFFSVTVSCCIAFTLEHHKAKGGTWARLIANGSFLCICIYIYVFNISTFNIVYMSVDHEPSY